MAKVMVKCPDTGKLVFTGQWIDKTLFERSQMQQNTIQCPACGKQHTWSKEDAVLQD